MDNSWRPAADQWTTDGARITDPERLERLQHILEKVSPVIIEHRFYRGSSAPHRFVTDNFDKLTEYLATKTRPGDSFYMWLFEDCCRDDNAAEVGKVPDEHGRVPRLGAY